MAFIDSNAIKRPAKAHCRRSAQRDAVPAISANPMVAQLSSEPVIQFSLLVNEP
jgi:hypothetical protein